MQVTETFAFIDLGSGDRGLADCIAGLNNTKWKGKVVRVKYRCKVDSKFRLPKAIVGPCTVHCTLTSVLPDEAAAGQGELHGKIGQGEKREGIRRLDFSLFCRTVTSYSLSGGPGVGAQVKSGGGDTQVKVEAAAPLKPLTGKQDRGLDGGRLAGGKLRKRDFTEEQEDFKGFNIKKPSSDTKYDPMGIFKANLAGDNEVGRVEGPVEASEGDGKVKDGMVIFGEEEGAGGEEELFNVQKMKVNSKYFVNIR